MLKVYYLKVSDYENMPDEFFYAGVSGDTLGAVRSYRNEKVRRTKLLGEGMVRQLFEASGAVGCRDYKITRTAHGKPYAEGMLPPLFFNISHSGDYIICAVSDCEVGVDLEKKVKARMGVARRFFHPAEVRRLEALSGVAQDDLFFGYWSVKESFLKYTGSGLSSPLSGFEVRFEADDIYVVRGDVRCAVYIRTCQVDDGYKCFVCSEKAELPEVLRFHFVFPPLADTNFAD